MDTTHPPEPPKPRDFGNTFLGIALGVAVMLLSLAVLVSAVSWAMGGTQP